MTARVMATTTPVSNYAAQESPSLPYQNGGVPVRAEPGKSVFHKLARAWFAIRWRLAETVFAKPIPWVTANLELKLGDVIVTLPVAIGFLGWNAMLAVQVQVKESGTPASLMMLLVFALTVRNNSILLSLTGLPYEHALLYHKFFGVVAILVAGLHGLAYLREDAGVSIARRRLTATGRNADIYTYQEPTFAPEFSGAIIFYLLLALFVLSLNPIRRRFYELFLRTHVLLFLGIIVFSAIHGAGLVLVGAGIWALDMVFRHAYVAPKYWKGSPISAKRMGVLAREQISLTKLPGEIVRIQFPRVRTDNDESFHYKAGQYVFVCVPKLGYLEWHPFTISSSPHEAFVTIHVKALGDWTKRLMQQVSSASGEATSSNMPVPAPFALLFDGPYGQVSLDIASPKTYAHVALFSGGIGLTPMQAIANQLHYEYHHEGRHALKKVRFVWSVRDRATIQALFSHDFVEFKKQQQLQMTSPAPYLPDLLLGSAANELRDVFYSEFFLTKGTQEAENPVDQSLQHCLRYNTRPRVRETLQSLGEDAKAANNTRVAVLVCGPAAMVKDVVTQALSLSREMKISFDVHTESFDF